MFKSFLGLGSEPGIFWLFINFLTLFCWATAAPLNYLYTIKTFLGLGSNSGIFLLIFSQSSAELQHLLLLLNTNTFSKYTQAGDRTWDLLALYWFSRTLLLRYSSFPCTFLKVCQGRRVNPESICSLFTFSQSSAELQGFSLATNTFLKLTQAWDRTRDLLALH